MKDTEPGVFYSPTQEDLAELARLYESCMGFPLNCATAAVLEQWFEKMEPALIREAIRRTGIHARRPCVAYANAILMNWETQGIHDMAAMFKAEKTRQFNRTHQRRMGACWWNASNFSERSYSREESEKDYFDLEKFFEDEAAGI